MASSPLGSKAVICTLGRGFASMDPERQREVVGFVRPSAIETTPQGRSSGERSRTARLDWLNVQPDRDSSNYEGSSSRRGR